VGAREGALSHDLARDGLQHAEPVRREIAPARTAPLARHLSPESVVFDPNMDRHHHLIDQDTGSIHDVPWNRVEVCNIEGIGEYEISDYQVVMHGRKR
jgi:hypothetical protein